MGIYTFANEPVPTDLSLIRSFLSFDPVFLTFNYT